MVRNRPQRLRIELVGLINGRRAVGCFQSAYLGRRDRLGLCLRHRRGSGHRRCCNLLYTGCGLRHGRGRVVLLLRALQVDRAGLLALLVAAATPAPAPAPSFALLAGLARLLLRLRRRPAAGGFAGPVLALGRLRPLLLSSVTPTCVLLRMALILPAAPAVALSL